MAIPTHLLAATESRAPGFCTYGGPGLKKTNAIATLPPPILMLDTSEGGSGSVLPWVRRRRLATSTTWTVYTDAQREYFLSLLHPDVAKNRALAKPGPYIDIIQYDNTDPDSFDKFIEDLANFDVEFYNALACDSLHELAELSKTHARGNFDSLMSEVNWSWAQAQERTAQRLRKIRNYRDQGIFVYLTGADDIAKDYVKNPMDKRKDGESAPEAYSVRGTVDLPGQLAKAVCYVPDVLMHAKLGSVNGQSQPVWCTRPEKLPGGGASWDAKDRYGRLAQYEPPNFRLICKKLYGDAGYKALYEYALGTVVKPGSDGGQSTDPGEVEQPEVAG